MRTKPVSIRLSHNLWDIYYRNAAEAGVNLSVHVRSVLERAHTLEQVQKQYEAILAAIGDLGKPSGGALNDSGLQAALARLTSQIEANQRESVIYLRAIAVELNPQLAGQVTARLAQATTNRSNS